MPDDEISLRQWMDERFDAQQRAVEQLAVSHHREVEALALSTKTAVDALAKSAAQETALLATQVERIAALHAEAHAREHALTGDALDKAAVSMEKRLESMNEFRDQLREQASTFVRRDMMDQRIAAIISRAEQDMRAITERIDRETLAVHVRITDLTTSFDTRIKVIENLNSNMNGRFWALGVGLGLLVVVMNFIFK